MIKYVRGFMFKLQGRNLIRVLWAAIVAPLLGGVILFSALRPPALERLLQQGIEALEGADEDAALACFWEGLELAKRKRDAKHIDYFAQQLGQAQEKRGACAAAVASYEQAMSIALKSEGQPGADVLLAKLAALHQRLGEHQKALERYMQTLSRARDKGDKRAIGEALFLLGMASMALRQIAKAQGSFEDALRLAREAENLQSEVIALFSLGSTQFLLSQEAEARSSLFEAVRLDGELGRPAIQWRSHIALSMNEELRGRDDVAVFFRKLDLNVFLAQPPTDVAEQLKERTICSPQAECKILC